MRVLIINRANAYEDFGGDVVQMENTVAHLRALGVEADVALGPREPGSFGPYDLVHLFNLQTPDFTLSQLRAAKQAGKKVVVSTIWWDFYADEHVLGVEKWMEMRRTMGAKRTLRELHKWLDPLSYGQREAHRSIITGADMLLPNSRLEIGELRKLTPFSTLVRVVPNGIDPDLRVDDEGAAEILREHGLKDKGFILIGGRVEQIKNQLDYTLAVRGLGLPVVCAGSVREPYGSRCREAGAVLLGRLAQPVMHALCKRAAVHALPSFRETPGLASLEAAALGRPIVSTSRGSAWDYFGWDAAYCDPYSPDSMRRATQRALRRSPRPRLAERVRRDFTWRRAAEETLAAYRSVLA